MIKTKNGHTKIHSNDIIQDLYQINHAVRQALIDRGFSPMSAYQLITDTASVCNLNTMDALNTILEANKNG